MQSTPWKRTLTALHETSVLAEWRLASGVQFYMQVPAQERLTEQGVEGSTVEYAEISALVIRREQPLGGVVTRNDLELVRQKLEAVPGLLISATTEALHLTPHSSGPPPAAAEFKR
jgi:hypothetical protein